MLSAYDASRVSGSNHQHGRRVRGISRSTEMLSHSRCLTLTTAKSSRNARAAWATLPFPVTALPKPQRYHKIASKSSRQLTHAPSQTHGLSPSCRPSARPFLLPVSNMATHTQAREHAGHSHTHHHHNNTYLTSSNKNDAGVRITRTGLFVNLGMAVGKGIGGWVFNSQALIADAFHALTDLVSDFMTLATISWSLKPPTARFPNGYGKIESLGALGVSGILLFGGAAMALNSLDLLYLQFLVNHAHDLGGHGDHGDHAHGLFGFGHSHSHSTDLPNVNAAWLAAGSIAVKEWLYRASELASEPGPCQEELTPCQQ